MGNHPFTASVKTSIEMNSEGVAPPSSSPEEKNAAVSRPNSALMVHEGPLNYRELRHQENHDQRAAGGSDITLHRQEGGGWRMWSQRCMDANEGA